MSWGFRPWMEFEIDPSSGRHTKRRLKAALLIIDSTYDNLDLELANLPANLPSLAERNKAELVAEWSARARMA